MYRPVDWGTVFASTACLDKLRQACWRHGEDARGSGPGANTAARAHESTRVLAGRATSEHRLPNPASTALVATRAPARAGGGARGGGPGAGRAPAGGRRAAAHAAPAPVRARAAPARPPPSARAPPPCAPPSRARLSGGPRPAPPPRRPRRPPHLCAVQRSSRRPSCCVWLPPRRSLLVAQVAPRPPVSPAP